jgi:hypothetical protein
VNAGKGRMETDRRRMLELTLGESSMLAQVSGSLPWFYNRIDTDEATDIDSRINTDGSPNSDVKIKTEDEINADKKLDIDDRQNRSRGKSAREQIRGTVHERVKIKGGPFMI